MFRDPVRPVYIFALFSLWLSLDYFVLGPYSYLELDDSIGWLAFRYAPIGRDWLKYGINYWFPWSVGGVDLLSLDLPPFSLAGLTFSFLPAWIANTLFIFVKHFFAGYFNYRLCRDHLKLPQSDSIIAGLFYGLYSFSWITHQLGIALLPFVLWSLESLYQRRKTGKSCWIWLILLGVIYGINLNLPRNVVYVFVGMSVWFIFVQRILEREFLLWFIGFWGVVLLVNVPVLWALMEMAALSVRNQWWDGMMQHNPYFMLGQYSGSVFRARLSRVMLILALLAWIASFFRDKKFNAVMSWTFILTIIPFIIIYGRPLMLGEQKYPFISSLLSSGLRSLQLERVFVIIFFFCAIGIGYIPKYFDAIFTRLRFLPAPIYWRLTGLSIMLVVVGLYVLKVTIPTGRSPVLLFGVILFLCPGLFLQSPYRKILFLLVLIILVRQTMIVKQDHIGEWLHQGHAASFYGNSQLKELAQKYNSEFNFRTIALSSEGVLKERPYLAPSMPSVYGLESADGVLSMTPLRYGELLNKIRFKELPSQEFYSLALFQIGRDVPNEPSISVGRYLRLNLLSLANVRFIVSPMALDDPELVLISAPETDYQIPDFRNLSLLHSIIERSKILFSKARLFYIYENRNVLPRVFVVGQYKTFKDSRKLLDAIAESSVQKIGQTVYLEERFLENISNPNWQVREYTVELRKYSPDRIELTTKVDGCGMLLITNSYNPYWKVYINGSEGTIVPAYHAFWGVPINSDTRTITFEYDPPYRLSRRKIGSSQ